MKQVRANFDLNDSMEFFKRVDPQVDANVLIKITEGIPEFVVYAQANQTSGLSYNFATRDEFLAQGHASEKDLQLLEQQFGAKLISDVSVAVVEDTARRLQRAFQGDALGRVLHDPDARVAATAFLKKEIIATGDLQLFKRMKDLGLDVAFVGTSRAQARAQTYRPKRVTIG